MQDNFEVKSNNEITPQNLNIQPNIPLQTTTDSVQPIQSQQSPIIKKQSLSKTIWWIIISGFIGGLLSFAFEILISRLFSESILNMGGDLGAILLVGIMNLAALFLIIILLSVIASLKLAKKLHTFSFWKFFIIIAITSYVFSQLVGYVSNTIYGFYINPGFTKSVDKWNNFSNADFSLSYPKDTTINEEIITPGTIQQVRVIKTGDFYEDQKSVTYFDISKVDPSLYGGVANSATPTTLEAYTKKVFDYNKLSPKKDQDGLGYSFILVDEKINDATVGGEKAFSFVLAWGYQGPEGEYRLRQPNGYSKGIHSYYFVEHNGSIYQIHFQSSDTDENVIGEKIFNTFKFKSINTDDETSKAIDYSKCTNISSVLETSQCYAALAQENQDALICEKTPNNGSYDCYTELAIKANDVKYCDKINNTMWPNYNNQCYEMVKTGARKPWILPDTVKLTESEARAIAETSCLKSGESLSAAAGTYIGTSESFTTDSPNTWWFKANLASTPKGCTSSCVVSEEARTVEIRDNCNGLMVPK